MNPPNRLAAETSPYLLQHQHNPVDWFPWGGEAFATARALNKPVFLSVGYSTCHWCHVMAHESFENPDIAALLNEYFVNIKVDREERPDVDRVYLAFVQASTGAGGWPMSVWMTPDAEPFFGGTYFPPTDRDGRPGILTVIERIAEVWSTEPTGIRGEASRVMSRLREAESPRTGEFQPNPDFIRSAFVGLRANFDSDHGGFGSAPKFPRPSLLNLLIRIGLNESDHAESAREMALQTLRKMAAGGIHDHLDGGFHRYSVDAKWHVPHFEKMLYDQAQLAASFVEGYQVSGDSELAETARRTLNYAARNLRHPDGGFFSAEDADSLIEHESTAHSEGAFYVWTKDEISNLLNPAEAEILCEMFGIQADGNVDPSSDPFGELRGKNVLFQTGSPTAVAARIGTDPKEFSKGLETAIVACRTDRDKRPRPHRDEKVITAWNGLMISALAKAGGALTEPRWLELANDAVAFLHTHCWNGESLRRTWCDGQPGHEGFVEDYAFLIQGLLDLYEASFSTAYLEWALELQTIQDAKFLDPASGTYFGNAAGDPFVPVRMKEDFDGAEPAANSVSALNLLRLGAMCRRQTFTEAAHRILGSCTKLMHDLPGAVPQMLVALEFALQPSRQEVIVGSLSDPDTIALAASRRSELRSNRVLLHVDPANSPSPLTKENPLLAEMKPINGKATLYACENFTCQAPATWQELQTKNP